MTGHKPFSELAAKMSPERQAQAHARTTEMLTEMVVAEALQFLEMKPKESDDGTFRDVSDHANKHRLRWKKGC